MKASALHVANSCSTHTTTCGPLSPPGISFEHHQLWPEQNKTIHSSTWRLESLSTRLTVVAPKYCRVCGQRWPPQQNKDLMAFKNFIFWCRGHTWKLGMVPGLTQYLRVVSGVLGGLYGARDLACGFCYSVHVFQLSKLSPCPYCEEDYT